MKTILTLLVLTASAGISSSTFAGEINSELNSPSSFNAEVPAEVEDFVKAQVALGQWDVEGVEAAMANYREYLSHKPEQAEGSGPFDFLKMGKHRSHAHFKKGHHPIKCPNGRCH